jgi:hypothetical protein
MSLRSATISIRSSETVLSDSRDVRRALAAGFTPEEVVFMFALDVPGKTEIEVDEDEPAKFGAIPDIRARR